MTEVTSEVPPSASAAPPPVEAPPASSPPSPAAAPSAPSAASPPAASPHAHVGQANFARALCLFVAICSLLWLVRLLVLRKPVEVEFSLQVLACLAAFFSSLYVALHQWHRWACSLHELEQMLPKITSGEAPISELQTMSGELHALVPALQRVFHDLRSQKAELARLNLEMQQRVANRTDALERVIGSLRQQATKDALTSLYNRRMLDQHLPELISRARNEGLPLTLVMIDLDHFKQVNDTLGHDAGDAVLKSVAQLIKSTIRDKDIPFRNGGDEFVILLPGSQPADAAALGRRLKSLVDAMVKTMKLNPKPSLSLGIACLDEIAPATDAATLVRFADKKLYEAKAARPEASRSGVPPTLPAAPKQERAA